MIPPIGSITAQEDVGTMPADSIDAMCRGDAEYTLVSQSDKHIYYTQGDCN
jgi:hypothetical protein